MALLADKSADAGSNLVRGTGTNSITFPMPGNVALTVEAVVATVDNSAGGATTALLTIKDSSGEVIAEKRQGETIDAGASGTATWALRLDDEGGGGTGGTTALERVIKAVGETVTAGNTKTLAWQHNSGDTLLDYTTPAAPTVIDTGMYSFTIGALVSAVPGPIANGAVMYGVLGFNDFGVPAGFANQIPFSNALGTLGTVGVSVTRPVDAGTPMTFTVQNLGANTATFQLYGFVVRLS